MTDAWSGTKQFRLVVVGSGRVGKTSLIWRFIHGRFCSQYQPTIEDSYRQLIQLPDGRFKSVEILDTAGMYEFPAMRDLSIKSSQCFIVVFAINSRSSFNEAQQLINHIYQAKQSRDVPLLLVANKRDLVDSREISSAEALHLATHNACSFVETSAKCDVTVGDVFTHLLTRAFQQVPASTSSLSIAAAATTHPHPPPSLPSSPSLPNGAPLNRSVSVATTAAAVSNGNRMRNFFLGAIATRGGRSSSRRKKKKRMVEEEEEEEADGRGSGGESGKRRRRKRERTCAIL